MKCRELIDFITDYVEGELAEVERTTFESHLHLCPPCVDYIESYRRAIALGREALDCVDERVPDDVPDDLVRAILEARSKSS